MYFSGTMIRQITSLIAKDIKLEFRNKFALFSVLLYVLTTVYVVFLAFNSIGLAKTWNAIYWIILIFAAVQMSSRSFANDTRNRFWYTYQIVKPQALILSKIIFNSILLTFIGFLSYFLIQLFLGSLIKDPLLFFLIIIVGSFGFSSVLTMVAGIASHTEQNAAIMAILSIPLLFPLIIMLMRASEYALLGLDTGDGFYNLIWLLGGLNIMIMVMSYILFPYLWRE